MEKGFKTFVWLSTLNGPSMCPTGVSMHGGIHEAVCDVQAQGLGGGR
jgi:hypothetical protein